MGRKKVGKEWMERCMGREKGTSEQGMEGKDGFGGRKVQLSKGWKDGGEGGKVGEDGRLDGKEGG